jgi:SAM-dependent methyltransferase
MPRVFAIYMMLWRCADSNDAQIHDGKKRGKTMEAAISQGSMHAKMYCPVCNKDMKLAGEAGYYTLQRKFKTPILHCDQCDIYGRDVDSASLVEHYYAASYVQPVNEQRLLTQRQSFFDHILKLVSHRLAPTPGNDKPVLVDFGSSYGHLLMAAQNLGFRAVGVELNQEMIKLCAERRLEVVPDIVSVKERADVYTLIDSLYCVPDPKHILTQVRGALVPGGLVVARVTNRNQYARVVNALNRSRDFSMLGDATFSYSTKGVRRLFEAAGFRVDEILPEDGTGKQQLSGKTKLFYRISGLLHRVFAGKFIVTPGMIVVARPAQNQAG